jgi:predicted ester cyclase
MIHHDFEYNDPVASTVKTKENYKAFISDIQTRSPDMKYETLDIITEHNKVVVLYSFSGTPVTDVTGASLDGIKVEHKGVAIYYFENDKIVKIWDVWDMYSVLKQLGKIP